MTSYARQARRWPLRLLITLILLAGVLVAVDRIGVAVAESAVAQTLQNSQHLTNKPSVQIDGFPFLTQLATGDYHQIELTDSDITVGQDGRTVSLEHLKVTLHDVTVARNFKSGTAASGSAAAQMSYAALSRTLGTTLSYAGAGRVKASASVHVAGQTISGSVTATPTLSGHSLQFVSPQVSVDGVPAPSVVTAALSGVFGAPIPVQNLPYDLSVQALSANQDGVSFTLTAQHLSFQR
ncbi:MAG: DUF2993 domain-containing protein [Jatrophihabitantaceae bacterium]